MAKAINYERSLRSAGVIKFGQFTARNGETGNCKVELDDFFDESRPPHPMAEQMATDLAEQLEPYDPEIIIPMPKGADVLGKMVGQIMGLKVIYLDKNHTERRSLEYRDHRDRIIICRAGKIALIDDVFRTGSAFLDAIRFTETGNKEVVGGVVWDRSDPSRPKTIGIPVEALVSSYVPMFVEGQA